MEIADLNKFIDPVIWYLVFIFSTTVHEASHAWSSFKMGDKTAYHSGQVSLNPIPHIKREPLGLILIPLLSYSIGGWMIGWGSAPYDYNWAYTHPKKSALMSAAGPVSNLLLILISALLIHSGIWLGVFYSPDSINMSSIVSSYDTGIWEASAKFISILFSLNLILFIFNLIPIPPLDGSGIPPLYLSEKNGRKYMDLIHKPALTFIGLFIAWKIFDIIHWKIFLVCINLLYPGSSYQ